MLLAGSEYLQAANRSLALALIWKDGHALI
jgi:hypothetical protein